MPYREEQPPCLPALSSRGFWPERSPLSAQRAEHGFKHRIVLVGVRLVVVAPREGDELRAGDLAGCTPGFIQVVDVRGPDD